MKYFSFGLVITLFVVLSSFKDLNESKYYVKTVVIDAGHGGHDPGCLYGSLKEKDIALAIALKTGKYITENIPDVKVVYTRETDKFIELHERAAIANRYNADCFISIHVNSAGSHSACGTETYAMGLDKSGGNLDVSKRENSVILMEEDHRENYGGFDPNAPETHIILSLYQSSYLTQSLKLAEKVEYQFKERVKRKSRGVKQGPFLVLWKTTMPSILVETGFITNPGDRAYISSPQGQDFISSGIYRAFKEYKADIENQ